MTQWSAGLPFVGARAASSLTGCAQSLSIGPTGPLQLRLPQAWKGGAVPESDSLQETGGPISATPGSTTRSTKRWCTTRTWPPQRRALNPPGSRRASPARRSCQFAEIGLNRNRQRINFIGLPIPGAGDNAVLKSVNTLIGLSLNVAWEPDVWGKVKAAKLAARAELQAMQTDLAGAQLSLTGQTAKAWFAALEAKRQLQLARGLESYRVLVRASPGAV